MKKECKASIAPPSLASGDATPWCVVSAKICQIPRRAALSLFPRARKKGVRNLPCRAHGHPIQPSVLLYLSPYDPTKVPAPEPRCGSLAGSSDCPETEQATKRKAIPCLLLRCSRYRPSVRPHSSALQQKQPVVVAWCSLSHRSLRQWQPNPLTAPHTALPTPRVIG